MLSALREIHFYDAGTKFGGVAVREDWPVAFREDLQKIMIST